MTELTYKQALTLGNTRLARHPMTRFIGYGLQKGRALGTLKEVASNQIIETPVAENLMMGLATGLALKGYRPVVFIERMDFVLNALDALVNHLDKARALSHGQFSPAAVIRCVVGNRTKPLYTGLTHTQDFSAVLETLVSCPVRVMKTAGDVEAAYALAESNLDAGQSIVLVEYKDLV